eukprot:TRINITY_DN14729_c0_g1_i2.p1 TRINITY_DN14729_c0_g1~~TRINITY_DN14729_c0_g1_i2.p1  ORF type:complete len:405 (+),score=83.56 TRINITY_DN14729_c0_g1_i2:491-1705(+)
MPHRFLRRSLRFATSFPTPVDALVERLEVQRLQHPGGHPDTAATLNNIGNAHYVQGETKEALKYYSESCDILESSFPDGHPDLAVCLHSMGSAHRILGNRNAALKCWADELAVLRNVHGNDAHPNIITALRSLAEVDLKQSSRHLLAALAICRALPDRRTTALLLTDLGHACRANGSYDKALQYFEEAFGVLNEEEDVVVKSTAHLNVGEAHRDRGDNDAALQCYEDRGRMLEKHYPNGSLETADNLKAIAGLSSERSDLSMMLKCLLKEVDVRMGCNPHDPRIAVCFNNIADAHFRNDDLRAACTYLAKELEVQRSTHHSDHHSLVLSLSNIGSVFTILGEFDAALQHLTEGIAMQRRLHPGDDPAALDILNNIGRAYKAKGDTEAALKYLEEALAMQERLEA